MEKVFKQIQEQVEKNKEFIEDYRFLERLFGDIYWRKHYIKFEEINSIKLANVFEYIYINKGFKNKKYQEQIKIKTKFLKEIINEDNELYKQIREDLKEEIKYILQNPIKKLLKIKKYKINLYKLMYENIIFINEISFSFRIFKVSSDKFYRERLSVFEIVQLKDVLEKDIKELKEIVLKYDKIRNKIDKYIEKLKEQVKLIQKI